ncbi:hypothetical protein KUTeg_009251 [Tegillarca granosa]|uniref:Uncharacterized protein n=1 Tax=Tegillarca granosa TaxID=220873 RepID=A0ABQ9FA94_TEGGR|nr:hypothetical protein KUTeg_009251 [Tegillarca granosa]
MNNNHIRKSIDVTNSNETLNIIEVLQKKENQEDESQITDVSCNVQQNTIKECRVILERLTFKKVEKNKDKCKNQDDSFLNNVQIESGAAENISETDEDQRQVFENCPCLTEDENTNEKTVIEEDPSILEPLKNILVIVAFRSGNHVYPLLHQAPNIVDTRDLSLVPSITFGFVESFIKGNSKSLGTKELHKGYKYFSKKYVTGITVHKLEKGCMIRAKCYRSQKKNESPHDVELVPR